MITKRYFPNLNGVRFIAASMVFVHHIEQAKHALGRENVYEWAIIQHLGRLGVGLFFVLSGFLITYLLLQEKGNHGKISTLHFYLRRIFRIWPVYFLIVLSSYFVFPHIRLLDYPGTLENIHTHYWERLTFLMLALPNFAFILYDLPYWCAQAWSIGVEEQFYYLWPWLIIYPKRRIAIISFFLIVTASILGLGLYLLNDPTEIVTEKILAFLGQFRLQVMALGGLLAWLVYKKKEEILNVLFRKDLQYGVYTLTAIFFLSGFHVSGFMEIYAVLFGFFIVNVACNPNSVIRLESKWINYLGKISYGIYLYHVAAVIFTINVLKKFNIESVATFNVALYSVAALLTVLVCVLSYEYMEKPLLRYKDRKFGR